MYLVYLLEGKNWVIPKTNQINILIFLKNFFFKD